jgi:acyl carrier protein
MSVPTEERVVGIVAARLQVPPARVPLDEPIIGGLGLDSFEAMEVVLDIEAAYDHVSLTEADARELTTLRQVIDYIDRTAPSP